MQPQELASALCLADEARRIQLLEQNAASITIDLADCLKSQFDEAKTSDTTLAREASAALKSLANLSKDAYIAALSLWTEAILDLQINHRPEPAIDKLEHAASGFLRLGQPLLAAATEVSKLQALGMLGRYDEALECGPAIRDTLLSFGDVLRAGVVEQNIGNVYFRRDLYQDAERQYRAARARFDSAAEPNRLLEIDTCLATSLIYQHKFKDARSLYEDVLARAEAAGQKVYQAVIECDLGCLALFQGRYGQALEFLERSRRTYSELGMPHESAIAEQELADAYLELNLGPEAAAIYERVIPTFGKLEMRAEKARALACYGRALLLLGRRQEARDRLDMAQALYAAEGNPVGQALVLLTDAQMQQMDGFYQSARSSAEKAEKALAEAGRWEPSLLARWLRAQSLCEDGRPAEAEALLISTFSEAEQRHLPQIQQRCLTSLGALAARNLEPRLAEDYLRRSIRMIEDLRSQLPSDELRTAFVSDKQIPYTELVRLYLSDPGAGRKGEAFEVLERGRSRALADMIGGAIEFRCRPRDQFEAGLLERAAELRGELNWFYSQITHRANADGPQNSATIQGLRAAAKAREEGIAEISQQLRQRGGDSLLQAEPVRTVALQKDIGTHSALVEYFGIDGNLFVFVITDKAVEVVDLHVTEDQATELLRRLWFQMDSLRCGPARMRRHMDQLKLRSQHHLGELYDMLFAQVDEMLEERRAVIVPHRSLNYLPFHALYDGSQYVLERREFCYAPSAGILHHCLAAPRRSLARALLIGVPDERAPRVQDEVLAVAPLFPDGVALLGPDASLAAVNRLASSAGVVHFACHGEFRADSPLFSSLKLSDGWLTVRDAYQLQLDCELVTLSACETGMSALAPGDELIGLARGFFSAGAPSLLATLWTVDDEATARLMSTFYQRLLGGDRPAAALRQAQIELLQQEPHPFFWSPFMIMGRW